MIAKVYYCNVHARPVPFTTMSHFKKYGSHIDSLLDSVKKYEGVFCADYHVRGLNTTFYPKWGESYKYLLNEICMSNDFYSNTPINIAKYWLSREQKILDRSIDERQ